MMSYPGKAITDQYPTRALCGKRLFNNAPFASSSSGTPHTCFEDTVLVPLASWIFLLALLGYIAYAFTTSKQGQGSNYKQPLHRLFYRKQVAINKESDEQSSNIAAQHRSSKRPKTTTFLSILYSLLVIATLLMNVLEIVRLYLADRGAGLLPFTLASICIILILMHIPLPVSLRFATGSVILIFWFFALIFTAVKMATLAHLQNIEPRTATEYLDSDQIVDNSVIIALYAVEVIVESMRLVRAYRSSH